MPFVLFPKQKEVVKWFYWLMTNQKDGLVEKTRDCGLTWLAAAFAAWAWIYLPRADIGFGSLKESDVDKIGNPKSILEKIRIILSHLPKFMLPSDYSPKKHALHLKIVNGVTNSTIVGEGGDNIGRGGRTLMYFKDESAHYMHAEKIEAAISRNSNVKIDISSVNGPGNLFYNKRMTYPPEQVFVFDWRDDPRKTQQWFDTERKKYHDAGIGHLFAQEIERDYQAAVSGLFLPPEWVRAAVDYELEPAGIMRSALDVADEDGEDTNAQVFRKGPVLLPTMFEWNGQDTTRSANEAMLHNIEMDVKEFIYDRIGVGAGIHGELKRLAGLSSKKLPFDVIPFIASATVYEPHENYAVGITNEDMFDNLKAQAWWALRRRFEKTWENRYHGGTWPVHELISIPNNPKLIMELTRPKRESGVKAKIRVEPKDKLRTRGLKSPNIAEAVVMVFADFNLKRELRVIYA